MHVSRSDQRTARVASLTVVNAMVFQQMLAGFRSDVVNVERCIRSVNVADALDEAWTHILDAIDYVPIFVLSRDIIRELKGNPGADDGLRRLGAAAQRITSKRAALRHDLMGRVYHRLLADAKFFGAYYTTIPAATLLLKLTFEPDRWRNTNFGDPNVLRELRVADLACGTGTLLKAALQSIADCHVRTRAALGETPNLDDVHRALVEKALWGFDVIPFAIHLAGSALALHDPDITFGEMNLRTMPLGVDPTPRLGSLDFLYGSQAHVQADLFGHASAPMQVTGEGTRSGEVTVPQLDLCVMNPPFVRSVGGNLLFGNLPKAKRVILQRALRDAVRDQNLLANVTAGLAPVFAAMADRFVKAGGHMSLVVPRALINGVAWNPTRLLLGGRYQVAYTIVSHESGGWNFSENTKLSECMVVAQKTANPSVAPQPTKIVNLWKRPSSAVAALTLAASISNATGVTLEGTGVEELRIGSEKYGELILCPAGRMAAGLWYEEAAFAQTELCRALHFASLGKLYDPNRGIVSAFPVVPLENIFSLGPDRRDIHDGFQLTDSITTFPAFWGHDTEQVQTIQQRPNQHLSPLARAQAGRSLRNSSVLWSRAGRLLIADRLRLNNARVTAVTLPEDVLSNTWWTARANPDYQTTTGDVEKIIALWLNSSLGMVNLIGTRVETEGAWVEFKKPILAAMPILDPNSLTGKQREVIVEGFDRVAAIDFEPLPRAVSDAAREQADTVLCEALGLDSDLRTLRTMLSAEPLLHG